MDTNISASELAGLVLGFLKESGNRLTARVMLDENPHLKETRENLRKKKTVSTKVDGMTLIDILRDYFQLRKVVHDFNKASFRDTYPGGERDSLSTQFLFILDQIKGKINCKSQRENNPVTRMDSAKKLFATCTTKQKRVLFDMKRTSREQDSWRSPPAKKLRTSQAVTADGVKEGVKETAETLNVSTDGQGCSTNSTLGASKRKKNLLSKKNGSKTEMPQPKSMESQQESPENLKEVLEYLTSDKAAPIHQRIADKITEAYFLQPEEQQSTDDAVKSVEVPKEKSVASEIEELVRKFQHISDPVTDMVLHSVMGESFLL